MFLIRQPEGIIKKLVGGKQAFGPKARYDLSSCQDTAAGAA